jgi:cation diffusion facilitator family transporter
MSAAASREKGSRLVLYAGLSANLLVAATKFAAASFTHSSAMLSEAVHSLVDSTNEVLLLYGAHRASQPPDREHPFGHGREVYFWSFVVSLMMFVLGAGVSIYEGVRHFMAAEPVEHPLVNYLVLAVSGLFEVGSWWISFREYRTRKGERGYLQAAQETKDPSVVIVFLENSADLVGIALAAAGTAAAQLLHDGRWDAVASIAIGLAGTMASQLLHQPVFDGVASIAIGALLAVVAIFTARENKQLLIGEGARPSLVQAVGRLARQERGVACYNGMLTIQLAPREVVVALSLDFDDALRASEVQDVVASLEASIRKQHPEVVLVLVKPQSPEVYRKAHERWMAGT